MKNIKIGKISLLITAILLVGCSSFNKPGDSHMKTETHMETMETETHMTHMHGEVSSVDVFTPVEEFLNLKLDNYKDYEVYGHRVMMTDNSKYITKNTGNIFMNYMIPHHEGAIITAQGIIAITEDEELKNLCEGIVAAQVREVKEMQELLSSKRLIDNEVKDFEQLMSKSMDEMMAGMVIPEDDLNKEEAEYLFLSNMIVHHRGAVKMAEEYLKAGKNETLLEMNKHIVITQKEEIKIMERLLKNRQM
ncbi:MULTISPECIES: DUF305 domain-containing protein [Psychrilyobacter]|uniref:DUF305 domain-containing protein n=1 Tax=Psychrilyobacter piezotolerans TaxID=2293438 RepID=A0ABX9KEX9_9FUSO|nr:MULTISPECIES: DUF305 domain-containing protein [Psychrilyobacter]MCS5421590.1 DUF305 domain-containing protein [Psychrilyobacter sp. S5]NDI78160.1 DUF305 domain-containing protein [Psychrilyobacter piezotolerans]RDE60148.1 DUF305 domain-containing protein [Psychrilyobacter sp. S5]REI40330.1 DUF305 domain-containing protein [Psychrilyobacter piezotolerans]